MRLRWHALILAVIVIMTVIILPLPAFLALFLACTEGILYGVYILAPSKAGRELRGGRKRLDR